VVEPPPGRYRDRKIAKKTLDTRGHVPILRSSFFEFGEEKEVIMTSQRNSYPLYEVCVRDIPET
jgi:hypothetical protein